MKDKRKSGPKIIMVGFIVIICFSWLLWLLFGKYMGSESYEKRDPAPLPELSPNTYVNFPKDYEAYFNDRIPFRNNLVALNSAIDYYVFNRSSSDRVIIGGNNWLFYDDMYDGDPISCYQGKRLYTEEQLEEIATNCVNMNVFFEKQGKEFVIFVAPNKERIYSEYMPQKYGEPAETYRCLQVINYLKEHTDVRVIYPYDELMAAKNKLGQNIYYKTDTHWNQIGGYVGASVLLDELGIKLPQIDCSEICITEDGEHSGDLAGILDLVKQLKKSDKEYSIEGYDDHNVENLNWDFNTTFVYHSEGADVRKIYVVRDSFSTAMAPYIGSQFEDSYFRHRETFSNKDLVEQDPEIVILEVVERAIDTLWRFSFEY